VLKNGWKILSRIAPTDIRLDLSNISSLYSQFIFCGIRLTVSIVLLLQVGVEIRDELQLIAPSEVTDDVSQEVSVTRAQSASNKLFSRISAVGIYL
jgi:hypothetical protein